MNAHGGHTATMGIHLISAIGFTSLCSLAVWLFRMLVVLLFSFQAYQEWHLYFGRSGIVGIEANGLLVGGQCFWISLEVMRARPLPL